EEVFAAGGHVICRGKKPVNPRILAVFRGIQDPCRVIGQRVRDVPLPRNTIDLLVQGTGSKGKKHALRLVMKYSPQEEAHILLFTTLEPSEMPAERVASLYRLRWQVELFFKECKSHSNLRCFQTADPNIAEGLIWASLLAVLFRRFLLHSAFEGSRVRFSALIAARMAWSFLKDLGRCVLFHGRKLTNLLQLIFERLRSLAARTNLHRTDSWTLLGIIAKRSYA
ncbi:MAG: transposase, partial [bacterium]